MNIRNFVQVSENIASSGQPDRDDFADIAQLGYKTIINLALSSSDNALPDEGDMITALGMTYVHIPVLWQDPKVEQFQLFASLMQQQGRNKVWVHCALNMRVSVFLYLYNTVCLNVPEQLAQKYLEQVWQPNAVWQQFIAKVQRSYGK